jgi:hypothetical protein
MALRTVPLNRRSFSTWLAASGFALTASGRAAAQSPFEWEPIVCQNQTTDIAVVQGHPPLGAESYGQVSMERRSQDGRPPSEWLRSMDADELRAWLANIEVTEARVHGMTFWTHLTRDHMFQPLLIKGLTELEQAKLHAAAHFGY